MICVNHYTCLWVLFCLYIYIYICLGEKLSSISYSSAIFISPPWFLFLQSISWNKSYSKDPLSHFLVSFQQEEMVRISLLKLFFLPHHLIQTTIDWAEMCFSREHCHSGMWLWASPRRNGSTWTLLKGPCIGTWCWRTIVTSSQWVGIVFYVDSWYARPFLVLIVVEALLSLMIFRPEIQGD